ncbi:hypothetical protein D3C76_1739150 [compost metagenome]
MSIVIVIISIEKNKRVVIIEANESFNLKLLIRYLVGLRKIKANKAASTNGTVYGKVLKKIINPNV